MAKNTSERAALLPRAPLVSKPSSGRTVRLRWLTSASLIALTLAVAPYRVSPDLHTGFIVASHAVADDGGGDGGGDDGGSGGDGGGGDGGSGGGDDGGSGGGDGDSGNDESDDDSGTSASSGPGHTSDTEDDESGGDSDDGQATGGVGFGGLN